MNAPNLSPRAITDLLYRADVYESRGWAESARIHRHVAKLIDRAKKYLLPDQGMLFDTEMDRNAFVDFIQPVDDLLLGEYRCEKIRELSAIEARESKDRIALITKDFDFLAKSWETTSGASFDVIREAFADAICVVAVYSIEPNATDAGHPFGLPLCAVLLKPREGKRGTPEEEVQEFLANDQLRDFAKHRGLTESNPNHGMLSKQFVPLQPEMVLNLLAQGKTQEELFALATVDSNDEERSATDLLIALGCSNTEHRAIAAPEKLNAKRVKSGKMPLYSYHVIGPRGELDGPRASPRSHVRRGHIRRIAHDRITWVRAALVNA